MTEEREASHDTPNRSSTADSSVPAVPQRDDEAKRKKWLQLQEKILVYGGEHVRWAGDEPRLDLLLESGDLLDLPVERVPGGANDSHANTAKLWAEADDQTKIVTGYALTQGIWVSHSWLQCNDHEVETTSPRERYFGVVLDETAALRFFLAKVSAEPAVVSQYPKVAALAARFPNHC